MSTSLKKNILQYQCLTLTFAPARVVRLLSKIKARAAGLVRRYPQTRGGKTTFRVYLSIDAKNFDADKFQSELNFNLKGVVRARNKARAEARLLPEKYWYSEAEFSNLGRPAELITSLIEKYREQLSEVKKLEAVRLSISIVAEYTSKEDIRGFYFSAAAIKLMSDFGIDLDIDQYDHIGDW